MKHARRGALAAGAAVAAAYLALGAFSGSLDVLARKPLLDGFTPPPPYRYVSPPANAATAQKPEGGTFSIKLEAPELGAGVFSTPDMQATLVTEPGVFPPGTDAPIKLTIEPLDPSKFPPSPKGGAIVGNVYRFTAAAKSGSPIATFVNPAHIVLVYPPVTGTVFQSPRHKLLQSGDGAQWKAIEGTDAQATLQVSADVKSLGLFAVEQVGAAAKKSSNVGIIVGSALGGLVVAGGIGWYVRARRIEARRRAARARKKRPKGR